MLAPDHLFDSPNMLNFVYLVISFFLYLRQQITENLLKMSLTLPLPNSHVNSFDYYICILDVAEGLRNQQDGLRLSWGEGADGKAICPMD